MDQFIANVDEEEDTNILPQTEAKVAYVVFLQLEVFMLTELEANVT